MNGSEGTEDFEGLEFGERFFYPKVPRAAIHLHSRGEDEVLV